MEDVKISLKNLLQKVPKSVENIADAAPWFDGRGFFSELPGSICVYYLVKSDITLLIVFVLYQTISRNNSRAPAITANNPEQLLSTLFYFIVSFVSRFILSLYISSLSFPSLLVHVCIRVHLDPTWNCQKYLDNNFSLDDQENSPETNEVHQEQLPSQESVVDGRIPPSVNTPESSPPEVFAETSVIANENQQVTWMNKLITRLWPHVGTYIEDLVLYKVLEDLKFTFKDKNMRVGEIPPQVMAVQVSSSRHQIFLDVNMRYEGDFSAYVKCLRTKFEIDHVKADVQVQIELRRLVALSPFVGEVVIHMGKPNLDVKLNKFNVL
ncbi:hypothetical protein SK128_001761 [Halocaridina rubra]|uniref:SMP-LTD domain-containing protein n=1 Tax=Halocaridina rubra TaxID=373956 RepID=A0AAN9AAN6_HALRR